MVDRRWFAAGCMAIGLASGAGISPTSAASPQQAPLAAELAELLVGVAKVDITPEEPVRMYGYASRKTESEGVANRLKAAALAIGGDGGGGPAILLTVDCGSVPPELRREVLERLQRSIPLKPERFMLCNSHNHSGPDLKGRGTMSGGERERLDRYAALLTDRLTTVVQQALFARRPGTLGWAEGELAFASNRRVLKDGKWSGFGAVEGAPVDHRLPVLRVRSADGSLMAVVVNYACHNTTLRGDYRQIHGDWAGCAQEAIEADHPGAVALVTIGCGADADPRPHGTAELCAQHGRALADEVRRVLDTGEFRTLKGELTTRSGRLDLPFASPPSADDLQSASARSWRLGDLRQRIERGEPLPTAATYEITTWSHGDDLVMVFLPDEVVVDYALRMHREFGADRLWINAYANDVSSYIVSRRLLQEGGYEVNNSLSYSVTFGRPELLDPPMEDRIFTLLRELIPAR